MKVHEKIKFMRESKGWTQEEMADKLELSVNGYANIERGETDVQISRLEKIAEIFGIELLELFSFGEQMFVIWLVIIVKILTIVTIYRQMSFQMKKPNLNMN